MSKPEISLFMFSVFPVGDFPAFYFQFFSVRFGNDFSLFTHHTHKKWSKLEETKISDIIASRLFVSSPLRLWKWFFCDFQRFFFQTVQVQCIRKCDQSVREKPTTSCDLSSSSRRSVASVLHLHTTTETSLYLVSHVCICFLHLFGYFFFIIRIRQAKLLWGKKMRF